MMDEATQGKGKTDLLARVASDTAIYGSALAVTKLASFLLLPIYTRALTPTQYAQLDLLLTFNAVIGLICVAGIDSGMVVLLLRDGQARFRTIVSSAWWSMFFWMLIALGVAILLVPLLFPKLIQPISGLFILAVSIVPFQVITLFAAGLFKWQRNRAAFLFFSALPVLVTAAIAIWLVLGRGMGLQGAFLAMLIVSAVFAVLGLVKMFGQISVPPVLRDSRDVFTAGMAFAAGSVIVTLMPVLVRLELVATVGLAALGLYAAADRLSLVARLLGDAFGNAWSPSILGAGGVNVDRQALARVARLFTGVLMIVAATGALWAPMLVRWVLGQRFAAAGLVTGPLFVAAAIGSWRREGLAVGLYLGQRPYWLPATGLLQLVLIALLLPIAARQGGVIGAASGMLLIEMIMLFVLWQVSQRVFFVPYPVLPACAAALAGAAAAAASVFLNQLALPIATDLLLRLGVNVLLFALLVGAGVITLQELGHIHERLKALGARAIRTRRA